MMSAGERALSDSSGEDRSMTHSTDSLDDDHTNSSSGGEDSGTEESSSSDWDVTSSDSTSSDTTLDIYSRSRRRQIPSTKSNMDTATFFGIESSSYLDRDMIGETSYRDLDDIELSRTHLLKLQTSHYNDIGDVNHNRTTNTSEPIYDLNIDLGYYLYSLFYPFTNYQALLFNQPLYKKERKLKKLIMINYLKKKKNYQKTLK